MRYSLRQLEVFLATAHYENVTRAAESLAMSQSAASGSLKELERQFDMKLFDRLGKRLQLSELGQQLRPQVESLMEQARSLEQALTGEDVAGRLEIGATLTIGNYIAVNMIADFRQQNTKSDIILRVANTKTIAEQVAGFELDMGLIEGELQHPDLDIVHWRRDELVVFAAPNHPLSTSKALSDQDLLTLPWIVREPGSGTRQAFDRAMQGVMTDLHVGMALQHTECIKRAEEAGPGVGCLLQIWVAGAF